MKSKIRFLKTRTTVAAAVLIGAAAVLAGCTDDKSGSGRDGMSREEAIEKLPGFIDRIEWSRDLVTRRSQVRLGEKTSLADTVPDIREFELTVRPYRGEGCVVAEIFASTEKSGSGADGWLVEVGGAFNASDVRLSGGRCARVAVRRIASGTGYQMIVSGKYVPQAFTPSNHLWVKMVEANGVAVEPITEELAGNVAGVVMKSDVAKRIRGEDDAIGVPRIIEAVAAGDIAMGYTDPHVSSTGLNWLQATLMVYADGDESRMLDDDVVSAFRAFQRGVPFVASTTLQMRESVEKDGSLDAFVMEWQTFVKTPTLQRGYEFIPFGIRHRNPLYAVGDPTPEQREVLRRLAEFASGERYATLAREYGFDPEDVAHESPWEAPHGERLIRAQRLWKEEKDGGRQKIAVFLADVSGSMGGAKIRNLRTALAHGLELVDPDNAIGLVAFSDNVSVRVPIEPLGLSHKARMLAAVEELEEGGGTAMYNGILVSLHLLLEAREPRPDARPILFVLSDGETKTGYQRKEVESLVRAIGIPVYTIGYGSGIGMDELRAVSGLVEAASLKAQEEDISYRIGVLLNAQL